MTEVLVTVSIAPSREVPVIPTIQAQVVIDEDTLDTHDFEATIQAAIEGWFAERAARVPALCRVPFQRQ